MLHIGGYTAGQGGAALGIVTALRRPDGRLTLADVTPASDPSFLAAHPTLPVVYAVNELEAGTVTVLTADPARSVLEPIAVVPSGGAAPCHVTVAADGSRLAVTNYSDGTVAVRDLDLQGRPGSASVLRHDGGGPVADRQEGPHAHMGLFHDGILYTVDLGADRIHRYRGTVALDPVRLPAGSGPRHLTTDGHGYWYLTNELDGTVAGFRGGSTGPWTEVSRVPASGSATQNYPSHLILSRDGTHLYVANRGPDTLSAFTVHDGQLSPAGEWATDGEWPRHFAIVGDHVYVANQRSHSVTLFGLPGGTGLPRPTGHVFTTPSPACILG